jgi:hypothetical protein
MTAKLKPEARRAVEGTTMALRGSAVSASEPAMTKRNAPPDGALIAGGDWSLGLNRSAGDSLSHAYLLARIGRELRRTYGDPAEEPVPDHMAELLRRLDRNDEEAER